MLLRESTGDSNPKSRGSSASVAPECWRSKRLYIIINFFCFSRWVSAIRLWTRDELPNVRKCLAAVLRPGEDHRPDIRALFRQRPVRQTQSKYEENPCSLRRNKMQTSSFQDLNRLLSRLRSVVARVRVPFRKFSHTDFHWATKADVYVYEPTVELMKMYLPRTNALSVFWVFRSASKEFSI